MSVSSAKQPRDGSLTQSEVSPGSVERDNEPPQKQRYVDERAFSIAFHIPYRVRPNSTTTSSSAEGEAETALGCSPTNPDFPPARYRSTSTRSTRPFFPLPGASNVISTPFSRAKWRTAGRTSTSAAAAAVVVAVGTDCDAGGGEVFGSRGCRRRATGSFPEGGCGAESEVSGWLCGGLLLVLASRCSDAGTSDALDASSSASMIHRSSPTLAICPS